MVQEVGLRERNRIERHQAFVRTAKAIVSAEGLDALTMQRLARDLDCAVGTAYTYFPSKSALVAELQRDAFDVLAQAYLLHHARVLTVAGTDSTAAVVALAQILGVCRFWVEAEDRFPDEVRLLQLLLAETGASIIEDGDIARVLPAGIRILDAASAAMGAAAAAGALDPGDARERVVMLGFALNGVLAVDRLSRVDPHLFDGRRLALQTARSLLRAWGARDDEVRAAMDRLEKLQHIDRRKK